MTILLLVPKIDTSQNGYNFVLFLSFLVGICVVTLYSTLIAFASLFSNDNYIGFFFSGAGKYLCD